MYLYSHPNKVVTLKIPRALPSQGIHLPFFILFSWTLAVRSSLSNMSIVIFTEDPVKTINLKAKKMIKSKINCKVK